MSLSSFFSSLETAVVTEAQKVVAALKPVWTAVEPFVEATAEELAPIAVQAVAGQALATTTGAVKFSAAVSNVVSTLASQGKSVALSNAASAVQAAYNAIWQQLAPNTPAPALSTAAPATS
jgi:hypothetical protein